MFPVGFIYQVSNFQYRAGKFFHSLSKKQNSSLYLLGKFVLKQINVKPIII